MPHYITLFHFTQKGVENIKQGPSRFDAGKKAIEAGGGKLKGFYVTMGQYDAIAIEDSLMTRLSQNYTGHGLSGEHPK
jgi:uncharacterized protein with GYD domain